MSKENFNEENELTTQDDNTTEIETTDAFEEIETGLTETDENAEPIQSGNPKPATSYSPEPAEAKQADASSPKGLVAIVAIMGVIIIGLIVFLVYGIVSGKNEEKTNDITSTPAVTSTEINVDIDKDLTTTSSETPTGLEDDEQPTETVTGEVEVPEFNVTVELGQYKGIEVDYDKQEVTEEDVQGALTYFVNTLQYTSDITDRPLKEGDIVVIDYVGTMDGEVFDGGSGTGTELTLGSGTFISGFEEGLIGKMKGDSVSLDLTFPDTYSSDKAGKAVNFLVNINEAYEYVIPELTDELVAENSEYKTVAEYTDAAREELEIQAKEYSESKVKNDIIQKVIDNAKFGGQVDEQIAYEEQECIDYYDTMCMQSFGVDGATYFGIIWGITKDEYLAMVNEESTMSVKYNAILDEVAKQENLTVTPEEYDSMFEETFINTFGFTSKEEVLSQLSQEQLDETVNGYVLHDKAEQIIMDSAVINNKPEE